MCLCMQYVYVKVSPPCRKHDISLGGTVRWFWLRHGSKAASRHRAHSNTYSSQRLRMPLLSSQGGTGEEKWEKKGGRRILKKKDRNTEKERLKGCNLRKEANWKRTSVRDGSVRACVSCFIRTLWNEQFTCTHYIQYSQILVHIAAQIVTRLLRLDSLRISKKWID